MKECDREATIQKESDSMTEFFFFIPILLQYSQQKENIFVSSLGGTDLFVSCK